MNKGILSPVDRADLAHCAYAAASQPAQGTKKKPARVPKKSAKKCENGAQKWVPKMDPKVGPTFGPTKRILWKLYLKPSFGYQKRTQKWDPELVPKLKFFWKKKPKKLQREPEKGPTGDSQGTWKSPISGSTSWPVSAMAASTPQRSFKAFHPVPCSCRL